VAVPVIYGPPTLYPFGLDGPYDWDVGAGN
jgi:hypothetical protein